MKSFKAKVFAIGSWTLLVLPREASQELPSRGMVLVEGTINGHHFKTPLEPDGRGSHWLTIDKDMPVKAGDTAELSIDPSKDWPEPTLPKDIKDALAKAPDVQELWNDITPMARWDWIRWIQGTNNPETRAKHIKVAFSKLRNGTRRPCCFNRASCTVPEVSKSGALLEPSRP